MRWSARRGARAARQGARSWLKGRLPPAGSKRSQQGTANLDPDGACRASETAPYRGASCDTRVQPLQAVSGSMVQNRKSPLKSAPSRILELRSRRQADATNAGEWTQAALARMVGASVRSVKAWESGDAVPRPFFRRRLAKVFGVKLEELGF